MSCREISLREYESVIRESTNAMFNHSLKYLQFLDSLLKGSSLTIFGQFEEDNLVGAFPFLSIEGRFGRVANSLPYFGSHGGIVCLDGVNVGALSTFILRYIDDSHVDSFTIVEPLFDSGRNAGFAFTDEVAITTRCGQVTFLDREIQATEPREIIFSIVSKNVRNMVRKAEKQNFTVQIENNRQAFSDLYDLHHENMSRIGGMPKSRNAFDLIQESFDAGVDYNLYIARDGGTSVAGLLVFYFRDFVEYWIPASSPDSRQMQPNSLLIFRAMSDVIECGKASRWNWGGTWEEQVGVHRFKKQWGAEDHAYRYFTKIGGGSSVRGVPLDELVQEYPGFFVRPKNYDLEGR